MANPLNNGTNITPTTPHNPVMDNIKNAIQFAKGQASPEMMIQQMVQRNPQAAQLLNQFQASGQSPKEFALNVLQQRGIDPQEIMKMIGK